MFLYKEVLGIELPWLEGVTQARVPKRLPLVLTRAEAGRVLARLPAGTHQLIGGLLYGSGLRLMEALRLRVKNVEFSRGEILVREFAAYAAPHTSFAVSTTSSSFAR